MPHGDEVTTTRLTDAERAVCDLAAAGLTNREIADRRCVSVKAVEFHLHNAYLKLNVRNRTQLALVMIEARHTAEHPDHAGPSPADLGAPLDLAGDVDPGPPGARATSTGPRPSSIVPALSNAIEDEAAQLAAEVLQATWVEIGDRTLDAGDTERLHRYVADGVAQVLERRHGLTSEERAVLEHRLLARLTDGADAAAEAGEPTASA